MVFLFAVEWIFLVLFMWVLFTQIGLPLLLGRPMFPIFRGWRKINKTKAEIEDWYDRQIELIVIDELENFIEELEGTTKSQEENKNENKPHS